ncbi:4205_t:CDS:2, partial [Acaulospora morrowiae]
GMNVFLIMPTLINRQCLIRNFRCSSRLHNSNKYRRNFEGNAHNFYNTSASDESRHGLGGYKQILEKNMDPSPPEGFLSTGPFQKFKGLFKLAPYFLLNGEQIQPLQEPGEFYNQLKEHILSAKERIFLASLYIGSNEKELVETIRSAVKKSKQLKVHILLDCLRSTRADHVDLDQSSPASLLVTLVKEFPDQVTVSLYHTPDLKGVLKKLIPPRFNESIGLMHIKAFGFDDNLMLSGANLSHDYFTNRQDRYMLFKNAPGITNYFADLLRTVSTFSYTLKPAEEFAKHDKPYELVLSQFPDPITESHLFRKFASSTVKEFVSKWTNDCELQARHQIIQQQKNSGVQTNEQNVNLDTVILPIIQMGPFSIRQDESTTLSILETIAKENDNEEGQYGRVFFASGYFNFTQKFKDKILNTKAKFNVLAASPEANGFYYSKGISKYIPDVYTLLEKQFYNDILKHGKSHLVKLEEYKRSNWTFHAK